MIPEMKMGRSRQDSKICTPITWRRVLEALQLAIYLVAIIIRDIHRKMVGSIILMREWSTRQKYLSHSKDLLIRIKPSLLITSIITKVNNLTLQLKMMNYIGENLSSSGNIITPIKKALMALSLLTQPISTRDRKIRNLWHMKIFGCSYNIKYRPNFNGTSKGTKEAITRPCPAPSQLFLNEARRTKNWFR